MSRQQGAPVDLAPPVLEPGATVGRFKVMEQLGAGRWGALYKVRNTSLQTYHVLRMPDDLDEDYRSTLREEFRVQKFLFHPNLVTMTEIVEEGAAFGIVNDFVDGTNLRDVLADGSGMELAEALPLFEQILGAVQTAHKNGLVHQSLVPGDVLLAVHEKGVTARVAEFGLWRALSCVVDEDPARARYSAPELFDPNAPLDKRSDIFSLGCILYEMLAGAPPFLDRAGLTSDGRPDYEPLATRVAGCPLEIAAVVERALELNPDDRYPDVAAFARVLLDEEEAEPPPRRVREVISVTPEPPPPAAPVREASAVQAPAEGSDGFEKTDPSGLPVVVEPKAPAVAAKPAPPPAAPAPPRPPKPKAERAPGEPDPAVQAVKWVVFYVLLPVCVIGAVLLGGAWLEAPGLRSARADLGRAQHAVPRDIAEQVDAASKIIGWGANATPIQAAVDEARSARGLAAQLEAEQKLCAVLQRELKLMRAPPLPEDELARREIERMLNTDHDRIQAHKAALAAVDLAEGSVFAPVADALGLAGAPASR